MPPLLTIRYKEMRLLRLVPDATRIDFLRHRLIAFAASLALITLSAVSLATQGLNLGIDFRGGILLEVRSTAPVDVGALRTSLGALNLGEVTLQRVGEPTDVLIRLQLPEEGDAAAQSVVETLRGVLGTGYEYRNVEMVGPTIGAELLRNGIIATLLAVVAIAAYVGFRFEWQFGATALLATIHDVFVTVGLISLLQIEFNTTTIAALLTLAGYSINDTVVVFDRIRETLRKTKTGDLVTVINGSLNSTLPRTTNTSVTTLLACLALLFFGGDTLSGFSLAITWGVVIGTLSSIYVGSALLLHLPPVSRALALKTPDEPAGMMAAPERS